MQYMFVSVTNLHDSRTGLSEQNGVLFQYICLKDVNLF